MSTLIVAVLSFFGFIIAYHTYGRWLARKIFGINPDAQVPSQELRDDVDYVPTKKEIIFGHHFTSIAGTGPIVGPAIAVFWGWLPALLWVVLGSIFIGAVHDFGALIVSLRNRGQTVGDIAGRMITPRAKLLFLTILFMALTVVLAIFGLVIAIIFALYPESVLSVWIEIPLAVGIGLWIYRKGGNILIPSIIALGIMYIGMAVGAYLLPINISAWFGIPLLGHTFANAVVIWTLVLFVYCFIASVLPVWTLLQPRDFINSHELIVALVLLIVGLAIAGLTGRAESLRICPGDCARYSARCTADLALPLYHHRLWCDQRIPLYGEFRHLPVSRSLRRRMHSMSATARCCLRVASRSSLSSHVAPGSVWDYFSGAGQERVTPSSP